MQQDDTKMQTQMEQLDQAMIKLLKLGIPFQADSEQEEQEEEN